MESTYPHFKFANNGWKLDYLASNTYPAWRKGKLDDNSKWKQKKGKGCKVEEDDDNNNNNNNNSLDEVGMKRKALALKLEESGPGKRFKGKHEVDDDKTPSTSTISLSPPASDTSAPSFEPSTEDIAIPPHPDSLSASAERGTEQHGSNAIIPIDPLAALALAASKARDIPPPPLSDTSQESRSSSTGSNDAMLNTNPILELQHAVLPAATPTPSTIPTKVDNAPVVSVNQSAKGGSKAKMRPGPAKNGHNLCAHRWHKQVQSSGSTEEFQKYYNSLTAAQRMEYDNEAIALAASGTWDTKSICNGTLY